MKKFAFLIHFRYDIRDDLQYLWPPLRALPESLYRRIFSHREFPSMQWGTVRDTITGETVGRNEIIPVNGEMLVKMGPKRARARMDRTVDKLVSDGFELVGLGALTAPMTMGGKSLAGRRDIGVTNGNAYTSVVTHHAVQRLTRQNERLADRVSIVGASGSVGSCLARQIVNLGEVRELQLVARNRNRLVNLETELQAQSKAVNLCVSTQIDAVRGSDLVILLTSSTETVIRSEHLKREAVILDGTQPRNTAPDLLALRPDVTVIDAGIVWAPGLLLENGEFGLPPHNFFACFAELALLALEGHAGHFSIGNPTLEQAQYIERIATKHRAYGFELAPFLSFDEPLGRRPYREVA